MLATVSLAADMDVTPTLFEQEKLKLRFATTTASYDASWAAFNDGFSDDADDGEGVRKKSPFKAFLLSAILPGAGQWYYGSRVKPFLFAGVEATSWVLYATWNKDGDDATDAYEAFNRAHWSREVYEQQYLLYAYGVTDDHLIDAAEISHHLPETQTQQYFEMTGKYDQFAWGWDDAVRNDSTIDDFGPGSPQLRIIREEDAPFSARRLVYEDMRDDANNKYDKARRMIAVSIINRLVSSLEAYFVTKHINSRRGDGRKPYTRVKVRTQLRSYNEALDTPYLNFAYKF
jgi:hypothetical protein